MERVAAAMKQAAIEEAEDHYDMAVNAINSDWPLIYEEARESGYDDEYCRSVIREAMEEASKNYRKEIKELGVKIEAE